MSTFDEPIGFKPGEYCVSQMDHDVAKDVAARAEMTAATMKHLAAHAKSLKGTGARPDLLVVAVGPGGGPEAAQRIKAALEHPSMPERP